MKHAITSLFLLLFFFLSVASHAQTIETKKDNYYLQGKKLKMSEVMDLMKPYPEIHKMMRSGVATGYLSLPVSLGGISLIMAGWIEGMDFFDHEAEANYTLIGVGSGLTIVGLIIGTSARSQRRSAVELYNYESRGTFQSPIRTLHLEATGTSVKMRFSF
ncbi:hypothetical protein G3570_00155 [Balneolaceae bacterium YR4-1]|uniref:Uncharacterized protein n=1 Tax=Halalkalibaculum roseum TaxID=2709311 RepID=A0A6M1SS66_9BACT|nr:hypothetical protein [Halalkalibaculum roseum]NGP75026.1 hypothetical protein [Halalkalibaculum roseum]